MSLQSFIFITVIFIELDSSFVVAAAVFTGTGDMQGKHSATALLDPAWSILLLIVKLSVEVTCQFWLLQKLL